MEVHISLPSLLTNALCVRCLLLQGPMDASGPDVIVDLFNRQTRKVAVTAEGRFGSIGRSNGEQRPQSQADGHDGPRGETVARSGEESSGDDDLSGAEN